MEKIYVTIDADLEEIIPEYLEEIGEDISSIRENITASDWLTLEKTSHRLKGSGGGYQLDQISEFGKQLENYSQHQDPNICYKLLDEFAEYIKNLNINYQEDI